MKQLSAACLAVLAESLFRGDRVSPARQSKAPKPSGKDRSKIKAARKQKHRK